MHTNHDLTTAGRRGGVPDPRARRQEAARTRPGAREACRARACRQFPCGLAGRQAETACQPRFQVSFAQTSIIHATLALGLLAAL